MALIKFLASLKLNIKMYHFASPLLRLDTSEFKYLQSTYNVARVENFTSKEWPSSLDICRSLTAFTAEYFFLYCTKPKPIDNN